MIEQIARYVIPAAFACLPPAMTSDTALALMLAIGLQESRFLKRRQLHGPARGFWQFEVGGVRGVMTHQATVLPIAHALDSLRYDRTLEPADVQRLLEHNDTLAACVARCLLWTLPDALPGPEEEALGWTLYLRAWRPGKPRPEAWPAHYAAAWTVLRSQLEGH